MPTPSPNGNHKQSTLLRLGLPIGSLQETTVSLLQQAGYRIHLRARSYTPDIDDSDVEVVMFRAQEISRYIDDGVLDVGITGHDWVVENNSNVHEVCQLQYSKATDQPARWVLAVPEESSVEKAKDLADGIIATELVNTTTKFFLDQNIPIRKVEFSWGATEVKARLVDAIVDITETGSSLRANNLRVIDTILTSTTRLIANHNAWADQNKRQKIEALALLLNGAINAREKIGLKLNTPRAKLDQIVGLLPAEKSPTISELADSQWVALEVIVDEQVGRELIPQLRRAGATGIISYNLKLIIP